ncbi:MAG: Na+/H+ antiporter [Acidobacteriaceae bacterium]|nr:Na+/H+ antiporter [Acidobacteriaceae bacterium]
MPAGEISHIEVIVLVLLFLVCTLALLAKRLQVAYPIVLVIGGLLLSFIPRAPRVLLEPNVVFLIILPPLVFSAAFHTSWRDFRRNLVSILMLAFGLVGFTVFGVAATTRWMLPGFDWRTGLVLGSVVAATDAIAATATAKRVGLPRRIVDLLEAESLVNDGSGLVALKFTLAMVISGVTPSFFQGAGVLTYLVFAALAIGLGIAVVIRAVLSRINEAPIEITIGIITPYIAYLAAESAGCSGVLATLACGLYLGRRSSDFYSLHARMEASSVWRTIDFGLNGVVFLALGLQLPFVLSELKGTSILTLGIDGALFSGVVIALRMLWVFPGAWLSSRISCAIGRRAEPLSPRLVFLVGWAGMRGVLALAAAMSLPLALQNGSAFPQRSLIIFLSFCAIFATLVVQGLSLPALIRRLGFSTMPGHEEEDLARREMTSAALDSLNRLRDQSGREKAEIFDQVERYYRRRLSLLERAADRSDAPQIDHESLARQLRSVERAIAVKLRDENKIHDEVLRALEHELDLLDARFAASDTDGRASPQ